MSTPKLFQYAILWHPTKKQIEDQWKKSYVLVQPTTILSTDLNSAAITAAMSIPQEYKDQIDQIEVCVKPF
jgi:uncharacterized protein YrzB (UPF0473 family)